jgi:hypothetical protein
MAIIIPEHCRGVTAGALRQAKQRGWSTNTRDGGIFSTAYVKKLVVHNTADYLTKREPLGQYMEALEQAKQTSTELTEAISSQMRQMVDAASVGSKAMMEVSAKLRDSAEKMGTAMNKFSAIANNTKFAETAKQAESLVNSLERLADLQKSGLLDKVMAAMK